MSCPNPVAFTVFGHDIYWYGILISLSVVLAVVMVYREAKRKGLDADCMLDYALLTVPTAIVFARLYYVIFEWDQYAANPIHALFIWEGGIAIYGSILGGIVATLIFSKWKKISFWTLADLVAPGLVLGQAIGRWGNFINREAFGAATELPWRMRLWTSATTYMDVHPTFFYESLWNVIGLLLLYFVVSRARRFDGENTCFYFIWYGLGRFWIEGLRTDSLYLFHWTLFGQRIRVSQAVSLVMVLVCTGILIYRLAVKKDNGVNLYVRRVQRAAEAPEQEKRS